MERTLMKLFSRTISRSLAGIGMSLAMTMAVTRPCVAEETKVTQTAAGPQIKSSPAAATGDLSSYRAIAVDTLRIVEAGDLRLAKNRITELETAWDSAEDKLKPRSSDKWKAVDKAIDRALEEIRASNPQRAASMKALHDLIAMIDSIGTI
jgi:hypothetical protein